MSKGYLKNLSEKEIVLLVACSPTICLIVVRRPACSDLFFLFYGRSWPKAKAWFSQIVQEGSVLEFQNLPPQL